MGTEILLKKKVIFCLALLAVLTGLWSLLTGEGIRLGRRWRSEGGVFGAVLLIAFGLFGMMSVLQPGVSRRSDDTRTRLRRRFKRRIKQ